jgi:ATP-binding cassette subfamily F protein 3
VLTSRGLRDARARRETAREAPPDTPKRKSPNALRQAIADAEAEVERITSIIAKIDTALALPDIFSREPAKAAQLAKARAAAAEALQKAEHTWLEASASYEEAD